KEYKDNLDKFLNEARCLTRFNHMAGIVAVQDFFYENETAYIVMDYVGERNVKQEIRENGAMDAKEVLMLMRPILEALSKIHRTGMVHRDISPDNILFAEDDSLVLIDFGSARIRNMEMTKSMTIVFKRGFSPEEQYRAKGKQGAWSDVYAVCATMYFMMTGQAPEDVIERMIGAKVIPLSDFPEINISERAKNAIMKGISIRAEDRYASMDSLICDLYEETIQRETFFETAETVDGRHRCDRYCFCLMCVFLHKTTPDYQPSNSQLQVVQTQKVSTEAPIVYRMVNVTGMKRKVAEQKINAIGDASLIIKWQKKYNKKAKKGILISQSIKKGESWTKGKKQTLTLTVSRGEKKIRVPNLVGLSYADAKKKLEKKKLNCRIVQRESDTISGIVLEQSKKTGAKVNEDTTITLTVSKKQVTTPKPAATNTPQPSKKPKKTKAPDFAGAIS
ncbi:MAG: protein kinase domain-containing protein, partial [Clostridium sp.]